MGDTIRLPDNFIGNDDRHRLESFGGHIITLGRAARSHWHKDTGGDHVYEICHGDIHNLITVSIRRNRKKDVFFAHDNTEKELVSGTLEHVMAELEQYFLTMHGEIPDTPA